MNRANGVEKLALTLAVAFFLGCAGRIYLQYGGGAPYRVSTTRNDQRTVSEQTQQEWPESLLPGERIDLNTAAALDLARLPQIGEKRAQAIVDWREEHGLFQSTEELMEVSGIGEGIFTQISGYITVSGTD